MASSSRMLVVVVVAALVAVACMKEVELKQNEDWLPLKKGYSGAWEIKSDTPLKGPFSFRYETQKGQRNVFDDIVPTDFKCGTTYKPEAEY
ncbi:unnamed protein product [Triticum turgidum subsp. durum]|uniref:Expansin-like CBD domain-containing protein n=1 Tax=Triticum turgidum subsp. durum TaxID=4567 RepID=A0A9R0WXE4_TRITD|nr:unnamed protein product [Triticum turgidum subsp. durum]